MDDDLTITFYKTRTCSKCMATKAALKRDVTEVIVDNNTELIDFMRLLGYKSFPIIFVQDSKGNLLDSWSDYNSDMIGKYRKE